MTWQEAQAGMVASYMSSRRNAWDGRGIAFLAWTPERDEEPTLIVSGRVLTGEDKAADDWELC